METRKHIEETALKETAGKRVTLQLRDGSVTTDKLHEGAVTEDKIGSGAVTGDKIGKHTITDYNLDANLLNQIQTSKEGVAMATKFGNSTLAGVSQKTLTDAINALWSKIEELTGETYHGIVMQVDPDYFIGEAGDTVPVHFSAHTANTNGVFETIQVFVDGEPVAAPGEEVQEYSIDFSVSDTCVLRCDAQILGVDYTESKVIYRYDAFWMGGGATYADVMDEEHRKAVTSNLRMAQDVTMTGGQHLVIVMGETLYSKFIRADLNGIEIGFGTPVTFVVDGKNFVQLVSEATYAAGDYNIDING